MKKLLKKLENWMLSYQSKKTPAPDKLAHNYWGQQWYAPAGTIVAFILLALVSWITFIGWACYIFAACPVAASYWAGWKKEQNDKGGAGHYDKADIWATVKPSFQHCIFLLIIISILIK